MTMSTETMLSSSEWIHFYNHNLSQEPQTTSLATLFADQSISDSTVVTTTFTSSTSHVPSPSAGGSDHLSPNGGRVSKPIRKRSRASRRTPTTLLNTDASNFRAMVQQFTGGPNQTGFQHFPSGSNFSFRQQIMNPVAVRPHQYPHQQQQFRTNDDQQQYVMNNVNHGPANAFLQRLENSRTTSFNDDNNNNNNHML